MSLYPTSFLNRSHQIVVSHAVGTIPEMSLHRGDVWGHFAPMFHLVDVFASEGAAAAEAAAGDAMRPSAGSHVCSAACLAACHGCRMARKLLPGPRLDLPSLHQSTPSPWWAGAM